MPTIVIISGSPNKSSRLNGINEYAANYLQQEGVQVEWIHVSDLPAKDLITANFKSEAVQAANAKLETADALIVSSQVYKASYTGVLKTYLDLIPQKGLAGKISLPLFLGGSTSHLLAIDYALKPVLSALGGRILLGGVYVVDGQVQKNEDGTLEIDKSVTERLDNALNELIDTVKWHASKNKVTQ